jgi:hypothetical protein
MTRMVSTFRQRDLTRAIRGAMAAGLTVVQACIELYGKIMLGFAKDANDPAVIPDYAHHSNSWDKALAS